jgi:small subunit ribosomal protein S4
MLKYKKLLKNIKRFVSKVVKVKSKKSRSYGVNLWGKPNDAFVKKPYYPGPHKTVRRYGSDFGKQNLKVQKLKAYYILTAKDLKRKSRKAVASLKNPVQALTSYLECQAYVIVYRAGFASTMFLAKQLVSHGHTLLNGKKITIKSIILRPGDKLELSEKAKKIPVVKEFLESGSRSAPDYLEVNKDQMSITLKKIPSSADVPFESDINIASAIEFYSR